MYLPRRLPRGFFPLALFLLLPLLTLAAPTQAASWKVAYGRLPSSVPRRVVAATSGTITAPQTDWNDLEPYRPDNWNSELPIGLVALAGTDAHTYSGWFASNQPLYINTGVGNTGYSDITGATIRLEITGTGGGSWELSDLTIPIGKYIYFEQDQPVGPLGTGLHTFRLIIDPSNTVAEFNEDNNTFERTVRIYGTADPDIRVSPETLSFAWQQAPQPVIASPDYFEFAQPGGATFTARKHGDEFYHWIETREGYTVRWNASRSRYEYLGLTSQGTFRFTGLMPGADDPAAAGIPRRVREDKSVVALRRKQSRQVLLEKGAPSKASDVQFAPTLQSAGSLKSLVILANFSDTQTLYKPSDFSGLYNTTGYSQYGARGSVKDYYAEASYGKMSISATISDWVKLPNSKSYYGANNYQGNDVRPREMVRDAIRGLDAKGFNFAPFDVNRDGWIDAFSVIHQGPGEEVAGSDDNSIWSHQWNLENTLTMDGVKIRGYHTEPEVYRQGITTIGVICHETGHAFGLPDLYDTDYSSEGVGRWCLMAGGSWNDEGRHPAHFSAWSKSKLGWLTPTLLSSSQSSVKVASLARNANAYKITQGMASGEYLLLENRAKTGFDDSMPGYGLVAYHVDDNRVDNNDENHYKVAVLQADGKRDLEMGNLRGDDGDPFPGSTNNRGIGADTNPSTDGYSNPDTKIHIGGISDAATTMTFRLSTNGVPGGKSFIIWNDGAQVLSISSFALDKAASWISLSPNAPLNIDPGTSQSVTVMVDLDIVPPGTTTRKLIISSNDPNENPYPTGVTISVTTPASTPILNVSPSTQMLGSASGSASCSVSNTGVGTMPWTAKVVSGSSWLSITSGSSGTNSGTVKVSRAANSSTAQRSAKVRVTATGATGSPIDVTLTQTGKPSGVEDWARY